MLSTITPRTDEGQIKEELESAFVAFTSAQEVKDTNGTSEHLKTVLRCLSELQYTKRDITFAVEIEPQTLERWEDGKTTGMKPVTYAEFKRFITDILRGKSHRTIDVSDTGFVTWRYLFQQQIAAQRIWYITSSKFLLDYSLAFERAVRELFLKPEQQHSTCLVYVYPKGSDTQDSLREWTTTLSKLIKSGEPLRGNIIGIEVDTERTKNFPYPGIFLPGIRATMLENTREPAPVQVEGYVRMKLEDEVKNKLLSALDPLEKFPHTPWLTVGREQVERWYKWCEKMEYVAYVNLIEQKCAEENTEFSVHFYPETEAWQATEPAAEAVS